MPGMWHYDDDESWQEWYDFRAQAHEKEKEYLEVRKSLAESESSLYADPSNEDLKMQVKELRVKLEELEKKEPWLTWPYPPEVLLWGVPHG
jgi:hypothetical protein